MFEIQGRINTAVCYATVVENDAIEQIRRMCDYPLTEGARIRIMPDVHAGAGCTVGTTMTITDKVVPNIVGVDIGCGMYTVELEDKTVDFARVDEAAHFIPSGRHVWDGPVEHFDLTQLRCYDQLRKAPRLACSLGTLGGGNHFIEIDEADDGTKYLIIHSGSRDLGRQVADHYQRIAVGLHSGRAEYTAEHDRLIAAYHAQGRQSELPEALAELKAAFEAREPAVPNDLCWLYGSAMDDYLHDVDICQQFALRSREKMAEMILERAGLTARSAFHTIHNYISIDEMILRKGAVAARKGQPVLIPINMRDGSILARGKGNLEWNCSAPHGAGRLMSRTAARQAIDLDAYRASMAGVYTTSVNESTLDEAPMAYKSIGDIIGVIHETVDVIGILKPFYNFKAAE